MVLNIYTVYLCGAGFFLTVSINVVALERSVDFTNFKTLSEYGDEWIDWGTLRMKKVSRTEFRVNGTVYLKMNIGDKQKLEINIHNFQNGKLGPLVFRLVSDVCKAMYDYENAYNILINNSDLPGNKVCPIVKNEYLVKDLKLDDSFVPLGTAPGEYLIVMLFKDGDKTFAGLSVNAKISI